LDCYLKFVLEGLINNVILICAGRIPIALLIVFDEIIVSSKVLYVLLSQYFVGVYIIIQDYSIAKANKDSLFAIIHDSSLFRN
jgi:hypothetical protein